MEANRAEYQAEINRLQQERDQAEKSRESEEKARKQAEQERDQAFNQAPQVTIQEVVKPDPADKARIEQLEREKLVSSSAKAEAEKARQIEEKARKQAEQERDQARNKPAKVEIQEREVIKSDPTDKARIQKLEKENKHLQNQLKLSNQLRVIRGVETTPEQRASLLAGQSIRLNGLVHPSHGLYDAHVTIKTSSPTEKSLAFKPISTPDAVKPQVVTAPVVAQAAPIQKPLPPPAMVPEQPAQYPTPDAPKWHGHLRELLKDARKRPVLTHKGYSHVDIKKGGKVVDLKIIHDKTKESVLLSEFAPASKLMESFGLSKGQKI